MKSKMKKQLFPFLLVFAALILFSCKSEEKGSTGGLKGIEVKVGNPVNKKIIEYLNLNANTVYQKQEIVRSTFQGFIEKVEKNIGDKVQQGELLFLIKTKEADAAETTKNNSTDQSFTGVIKILARTTGTLTDLAHQTGDYVSDGEQLATIVDPQSLKIILEVPFQYSKYVVENNSYKMLLPDNKEYIARAIKRIPSVDPANQTQKIILEMENKLELPSNLNLTVKIPLGNSSETIALPKSSVMTNETQTEFWVMRLLNDSLAVKVNIQKGIEADNMIQIKEPVLNMQDLFILEGAYGLPDTAKITIQKN